MPLQRAARAERDKLSGLISRVQERLGALDTERETLRAELARLRDRDRVLAQIVDPEARTETEQAAGVVLRGARLRQEAALVLYEHRGPRSRIHYREWYDLYRAAGFVALGKRPLAAFLTAVGRSPIVQRADDDEPGIYYIEPALAKEIAEQLAEVEAELTDLNAVLVREENPSAQLRQHRVRLLAAQRRLHARLGEAEAVLGAVAAIPSESASRRVA